MAYKHTLTELSQIANNIRKDIIGMLLEAGSGHSAGPLGLADVFTALYFEVMNHLPHDPNWRERDRLVLSAGHVCPVWYATLAHAGYFDKSELQKLRKLGSILQGHPNRLDTPGVENSSGPLGQGISQAIGMALASHLDGLKNQIYCVMGDGEQNEGQVWEAYMFAGKKRIHNLNVVIDRNNIQIDGYTEDVMPLEPLREKLQAFGWHVHEVDGHNIESIIDVMGEARAVFSKPSVIIVHTIPGRGVDFMEWDPVWHGQPPKNNKQAEDALKQLRTLDGRVEY